MSTSVLHSVKESLFSGDSHVDAEYDTAIARFVQLQKQTDVLKAAAADYCNSHYKTLSKSNLVSESFAQILEDPLSETGFETLSKQMLSAHSQLNADRQCALTARMSEGVLVPLEKLHLHLLNLHTKTTKRNELHKNLEYYLRKVGQLIRDREERAAKGKTETESQKDKLTRNQTKLDTVRQQYTTYAQPLIVELSSVWNTRTNYLGPVLAAFASVEKEFVRVYSTALDEVRPEVVSSAAAQPRVELTVPPVEGSSLIAPAGLDAAPIHTAQVGTVDATQSTFIHKAADPAAITASSATGLPLASIGQLPSQQQQPEQLKSTTTTVTGAAPLNTHSSETSQQLDLLTPKQQPISSSSTTTSGTEILSAPQAGTIDAAQSAVLQQQQPIQQLEGQQRSTIKSEHEEESKAQRFEQEHKTATQII